MQIPLIMKRILLDAGQKNHNAGGFLAIYNPRYHSSGIQLQQFGLIPAIHRWEAFTMSYFDLAASAALVA